MPELISPSSAQWSEARATGAALAPEGIYIAETGTPGVYGFTTEFTTDVALLPLEDGALMASHTPDATAAVMTRLAGKTFFSYSPTPLPWGAQRLHRKRRDGDMFAGYANEAAWFATLAGRGSAGFAVQNRTPALDNTIQFAGHQTLKMMQRVGAPSEEIISGYQLASPVWRVWVRAPFQLSSTFYDNHVDADTHQYVALPGVFDNNVSDVGAFPAYDIQHAAWAINQGGAEAFGYPFSGLVGRYVFPVVMFERLGAATSITARMWIDGADVFGAPQTLPGTPSGSGLQLIVPRFSMPETGVGDPLCFVNYGQYEIVTQNPGEPNPYSGLGGSF